MTLPKASREEMIAAVSKKCVEAQPNIKSQRYIEGCQAASKFCGKKDDNGVFICKNCREWLGEDRYIDDFRHIRLADVLWMIRSTESVPDFRKVWDEFIYRWDMTKDNISDQDLTTIQFLFSLLS